MRFLKVLILVVAIFLALVFLFQNQTALSQDMVLTLNLFFMEPMSSIPLPLYFMLIAAFALGALLSVCFLVWDKMHGTARFMKARWRINQLEREAKMDLFTGLLNKSAVEYYGARKIKELKAGELLGILILDMDDFKKVNDIYGHPVGDYVLKEVADIIGISQSYISRLEKRIIKQLKKEIMKYE